MKTYRETIYSIIEFVSGFVVTDDNPLDEDLIAKKMDDVRAELIKQEYNASRNVNDLFYQRCQVDIKHDNPDKKGELEMIQFYIDFPELLPNVGWSNIKYLGTEDYEEKYDRRTMDQFVFGQHRRYTPYVNEYIVIGQSKGLVRVHKNAPEKLMLLGLFRSPMDIKGMSWDDMYPIPDPFKFEMIVKQDILAGLNVKADEKNDAKHNQDELLERG